MKGKINTAEIYGRERKNTGRERKNKYCRNFLKYFNIVDEIYM